MSSSQSSQNHIINVIEDFDYSTQNNAYNERFREWRKRKNNNYAFNFKKNNKESVYIDGRGFVDHSQVDAEKKVLAHIFYTLGIAMLMWVFFDALFSKIFIKSLSLIGLDININLVYSIITGGSWEVVFTHIIINSLKMIAPMIYLKKKFKVSGKAAIMRKMNHQSALVGAISAAILVCVITSIPSAYSTERSEAVKFFSALDIDVSIWNQYEFIVYTVFEVIILPILSQLLFCGAAFMVLRQFGDPFAIIMTALSSALLAQDIRVMPSIFLVTLVGCYGMLTSGTIFTAVAVHIIYRMYDMTISIIETNPSDSMPIYRNIFMISLCVAGAVGVIGYHHLQKRNKLRIALYSSELSPGGRFIHAAKTFPYSVIGITCLVYAVFKVVL